MAKSIFISQPDNGSNVIDNSRTRARITRRLKATDFTVLNTSGKTDLRDTLNMMINADMVVFAPGWKDYRRCTIEHMICEEYGLPYFDL